QDSVGALQLVTEGHDVPDVRRIDYKAISDDELEQILTSYKSGIPLGMVNHKPGQSSLPG
ncbi:hypothetical protein ACU6QH_00735, partial [Aeromonas veronii]